MYQRRAQISNWSGIATSGYDGSTDEKNLKKKKFMTKLGRSPFFMNGKLVQDLASIFAATKRKDEKLKIEYWVLGWR